MQSYCIANAEDRVERRQLSAVDRCLKHPPLPGEEGHDIVSLEVLEILKGGDCQQSQVSTVRLLEWTSTSRTFPENGTKLVAKIYDPLYLDDDGYINRFRAVNEHYTHESNAYSALRDFQGQGIPKYYGSYSLSLFVNSTSTRIVRMILVEHIDGITMSHASPNNLPRSTRHHILRSIVDLESRTYEKDIWHIDLEPRNVIQTFEQPHVVRDDSTALGSNNFLGQYISPVLRWRKSRDALDAFWEWIDWKWDPWLESEFAHTTAGITPKMRERWKYQQD
ncbi:hypothetical protein BDV59DRAFT_192116 [Aspergillus ambiguus]|uniref:uncharacterized protein n=1 Tax=Aspergillus ambiguus TaxID=176160 RepID=UPI003CCDF99A